jgi:thiol-disulfide isomerase/thioredoxin
MFRIASVLAVLSLLCLCGWYAASSTSAPPKKTEQDKPKVKREFPDNYYYYPDRNREMEGKEPPALTVKSWLGEAQELAKLKGKVVVVDFWATWCPPCRASIPHNIEMVNDYKEKGLVFIGVHDASRGSEKMEAMAKEKKINYPLAIDDAGKSAKEYKVGWWPTYIVIDRKGIVRAFGLEPGSVEKVVEKLIDEK